ncbi:MAG: hypothetical protein HN580_06920 [Deltaproteobacteria bacterium]|jgi:3-oxoadipate enol-lactonase|nr:hypothetical protein [Deltaproteobacteria bacterium]MBT4267446.1 hypothetical protein [Deltaproteobacteria bacterium]MBT4637495.1 hypothetical protein [Deltaproteobacteria bacterium]MBT6500835.1 hypothetical protein [Deltaproteobacteria bacterium]MBT6611471.1 hypothetical protein [Deltaproteobacteria bacterium]
MAFAAKLLGGKQLSKIIRKNPSRLLPEWLVNANLEKVNAYADAISLMSRKSLNNILKGAKISNLPDREKLKGLEMPTLILAWHRDSTHPIESADTLKELIPHCEMDVVSDFDGFKQWPELIREFVGKLS